uniref:Coiled-coil domain-containing protein 40 n=1 Tax=Ciona intestinalis TaxID=7719 RepID=H2XUM1_CIOIN
MESDSDREDEVQSDLVVLDPDHPLMRRFQSALKTQLSKQLEKARLERKELMDDLKRKKTTREEVGVTLYGVQQELARQQSNLEQLHDKHAMSAERRRNKEHDLQKVREKYKEVQSQSERERKKNSELQTEVENLATRLFYMQNAKEDIRSDIAVMKRAAEKADVEVTQAEMIKKQQDLRVNRLTERVEHLRETIAMYEAQQSAQSEETLAAKQSLHEARDEIEAINLEKKQLYQQWNSSLIGMKRRDEAHAAMQEALSLAQQQVKSLETEISGYKRSIQKEEERNETLTMVLNKAETDKTVTKKLIKQNLIKQDSLKQTYGTYSRTLHETEQAYNKATTERSMRLSEINALRKQIEREYLEKVALEDRIMKDLQQQLTADKAQNYTVKVTQDIRQKKKKLEADYSQVENEMARCSLQHTECTSRIRHLTIQCEELESDISSKNDLISRAEQEASKRNAIIERKQTAIDQYNKKLEQLLANSGGEEIGPLEIQINSLSKQIEGSSQGIAELQRFWLRQQHELVQLSKEREQQNVDVDKLKKQHTILTQKKLRIEGEIDQQIQEQNEIERSVRNMQNAMVKNTLLSKEKGIQETLEQGNILTENEFIQELKEAELASIQMQTKLEGLQEEKERLLNSLIEAERQIMLWEKKTQLAKETRSAVDSEVGQGEMRAMKAEIHRMQVRYTQLMKQQDQMMREMEQVVSRRETIVTRGEAQSKIDRKTPTKGTFQKKLLEIKKKVKQTQKDAETCDTDIRQLRENQAEVGRNLEEKQIAVQQLQGMVDTLEGDIEHLAEIKQRNLNDLVAKQTKVKHLQSLKAGKYTPICKTEEALTNELQKQDDRMNHTVNILDRITQEFPHTQQAVRRV